MHNTAEISRPGTTVAELVARERPADSPDPRHHGRRARVTAAELLRREGVAFGGRSRRLAAFGGAAALCGLSIAGLVAFQPAPPVPTGQSADLRTPNETSAATVAAEPSPRPSKGARKPRNTLRAAAGAATDDAPAEQAPPPPRRKAQDGGPFDPIVEPAREVFGSAAVGFADTVNR